MSWPFLLLPLGTLAAGVVLKLWALNRMGHWDLSPRACEVARSVLDHTGRSDTAVVSGRPRAGALALPERVVESRNVLQVGHAALLAGLLAEEAAHPLVAMLRGLGEALTAPLFGGAVLCLAAALLESPARPWLAGVGTAFANLWMDLAVILTVLRWRGARRAARALSDSLARPEALRAAQAMTALVFDPLGGMLTQWPHKASRRDNE